MSRVTGLKGWKAIRGPRRRRRRKGKLLFGLNTLHLQLQVRQKLASKQVQTVERKNLKAGLDAVKGNAHSIQGCGFVSGGGHSCNVDELLKD